jgi:hypothetical protein
MMGGFSQIYRLQNGLHDNDYLPVVVENKEGKKFRLMWSRNTGEIQTNPFEKGDSQFPSQIHEWNTIGVLNEVAMNRLRLQGAVPQKEFRRILDEIEDEVISIARQWAQKQNTCDT